MRKKMLAVIAAGAMLLSVTPVFAAEDILEFQIQETSEDDTLVVEDDPDFELEAESLDVSDEAQVYASEETDTTIMEVMPDRAIPAEGATTFTYYSQYAYQCNSDYDVIAAYVKSADGKYKSRMFFIYDKLYGEWLRYDYSKMSAETFFTNYEVKNDLYIPVAKKSGGKDVIHSNNPKTAIDESKIPLIAEADVSGINFAWKALSEIPFIKNGSSYEYAGEAVQKKEEVKPDPDPDPTPGEAFIEINGNYYAITWTDKVQYDGRSHVWNQSQTNAKQVADLEVKVVKDGIAIAPTDYSVTCRNNTNVGAGKNQPYFTVALKGAYKKDSAKMSKYKFPFDITAYPVTRGTLQAKKAVIQQGKVTLTDPCFVFSDGRKVKLTLYNEKTKTGTFSVAKTKDGIELTGHNNFSGAGFLTMSNPKRVTYEW